MPNVPSDRPLGLPTDGTSARHPEPAADLRLGFTFEGVFRQHMIVKGRDRDTAWFSMLDHDVARSNRSSDRDVIDSNKIEHDVVRKPVPTFRRHARDTEWPAIRRAFGPWLAPGNFDAEGRQRASLAAPCAAG